MINTRFIPTLTAVLAMSCVGSTGEETATTTSAILQSHTSQVGTCQWPNVVHIQTSLPGGYMGFCTATMLRNGVFVTAAHCLQEADKVWVYFGENAQSEHAMVSLDSAAEIAERCEIHPDGHVVDGGMLGDDGYAGSDIAVCRLTTYPGGLPEGVPLTYGTCEEAYMMQQVSLRAPLHLVGTGASIVNASQSSHYGQKRHTTAEPAGWVNYTGKLHLKIWQPDPCAGDHIIRGGDSGGAVMMEFPDGSYRLIAMMVAVDEEFNSPRCNGGTARYILATPIAPYLPWIEHESTGLNSFSDLTRCHNWNQTTQSYEYSTSAGICNSSSYYTNPEVTGSKSWDDFACMDIENNVSPYHSGECAGWNPCGRFGSWRTCNEAAPSGGSSGASVPGLGAGGGFLTTGSSPRRLNAGATVRAPSTRLITTTR